MLVYIYLYFVFILSMFCVYLLYFRYLQRCRIDCDIRSWSTGVLYDSGHNCHPADQVNTQILAVIAPV